MIPRIYDSLDKYILPDKVLVIYGPRRVGKTVLLTNYLKSCNKKYRLVNGDDISIQQLFGSQNIDTLASWAAGYELIAIDEAQNIPNVGLGLKILVDNIPGISIIATGSASFELANKIGEPLTGRQNTLWLYPLSHLELTGWMNKYDLRQKRDQFLIFGSYPEVLNKNNTEEKIDYLKELMNSYLLKDILALEQVKGAKVLLDLLRLLAFQIGSEVSLNELAGNLGIDSKTVGRYLDLLEKSFILINLRGFSRNLRSEIKEKSKYYFWDNGIRNAIISNFNTLDLRDDAGKLWENFLVIERIKKQSYTKIYANNYFWRTWQQQEIDFIEERDGRLFAYEFKFSDKGGRKIPKEFDDNYKNSHFMVINPENYLEFIA